MTQEQIDSLARTGLIESVPQRGASVEPAITLIAASHNMEPTASGPHFDLPFGD
jgi:hypothetical protein